MVSSYRAVVAGNVIRWIDPPPIREGSLEVCVTLMTPDDGDDARRERLSDALEKLSALAGIGGIEDPAAWQRSIRADRLLPGREP